MKFMSEISGLGGGISPSSAIAVCEKTYTVWVSGSYDPPGQLVPPCDPGETSVASVPSALLTDGGVKIGPILYFETTFSASSCSSGVKSIRLSGRMPWLS